MYCILLGYFRYKIRIYFVGGGGGYKLILLRFNVEGIVVFKFKISLRVIFIIGWLYLSYYVVRFML